MKYLNQDDIDKIIFKYINRIQQYSSEQNHLKVNELKVLMYLGTQYQENIVNIYIDNLLRNIRIACE